MWTQRAGAVAPFLVLWLALPCRAADPAPAGPAEFEKLVPKESRLEKLPGT